MITVVEPGNTYTYNVSADPVSKKAQAVKSSPNSNATTYKYDKQKNVASYKYSGTSIEWTEQRNETFGNTIYEGYDEEQSPTAVEVSITHTYAENGKNENAVKKGQPFY